LSPLISCHLILVGVSMLLSPSLFPVYTSPELPPPQFIPFVLFFPRVFYVLCRSRRDHSPPVPSDFSVSLSCLFACNPRLSFSFSPPPLGPSFSPCPMTDGPSSHFVFAVPFSFSLCEIAIYLHFPPSCFSFYHPIFLVYYESLFLSRPLLSPRDLSRLHVEADFSPSPQCILGFCSWIPFFPSSLYQFPQTFLLSSFVP